MYDELLRRRIIIEFKNLIKDAKEEDKDRNSYVQFMKEVILNTYGVN
jgi:translation initiation factor 2 beta subunit (eIF-2beta)/eIF-5